MKWSQTVIPTLRQAPKDAEATSHRLMLRAGLIRQLSSGVYSYLPLGWLALHRVMGLIREEMLKAGAVELFLPSLHPAELWKKTGRFTSLGEDKFYFKNRARQEYVLGPTHEEVITSLIGETVNSSKHLPVTVFQIQTKFRDEVRPRFGVIRSKEFIMKDAYSFDADEPGLERSYQAMYDAYNRIFTRAGLSYEVVSADPGLMGGNFSHEFMLLADFGEDIIARCANCDYRASLDIASYRASEPVHNAPAPSTVPPPELFETIDLKTIQEISSRFKLKTKELIKALVYMADEKPLIALIRGDHEANEAKIRRTSGASSIRLAEPAEIEKATGVPLGFVGPVGIRNIPVYADHSVMKLAEAVTGGNKKNFHMKHVVPHRDFKPDKVSELRHVEEGDICGVCGKGKLRLSRAMEIGHVFKLGTRYSKPLEAQFINASGEKTAFIMGCYGIGVNRILAGAIEQHHDSKGIIWPESIAPFDVEIITVNESHAESKKTAERLYAELQEAGISVLYDDRDERAGVKFNDADLIGIPKQVVVGEKNLANGNVEIKMRMTGDVELLKIEAVTNVFKNKFFPRRTATQA